MTAVILCCCSSVNHPPHRNGMPPCISRQHALPSLSSTVGSSLSPPPVDRHSYPVHFFYVVVFGSTNQTPPHPQAIRPAFMNVFYSTGFEPRSCTWNVSAGVSELQFLRHYFRQVVAELRAGRTGVRIPVEDRFFSSLQNVQTDCGFHTVSYWGFC